MSVLFGTQRAAITKHLNNTYNSGEIDQETTCSILEHIGRNGTCVYSTKYYNLDDLGASLKDLGKKLFAFSRMEVSADVLLIGK